MALQWYLTKYARLSNGEFELLTYEPMPNLAVAQYKAQTQLPNNEFYEVECRVGSLLPPTPKPCWVARDRYSHKPHVAQLQCEAEVKAQQLLDILDSNIFDIKSLLEEIRLLKPILTKPQYSILLNTLMSKPYVTKILYERGAI
jgi:hypothetical protein